MAPGDPWGFGAWKDPAMTVDRDRSWFGAMPGPGPLAPPPVEVEAASQPM